MAKKGNKHNFGNKLLVTGKIGRLVKIVLTRTKRTDVEYIFKNIDKFKLLDAESKAEYVKEIVRRMRSKLGNKETVDILKSCGTMCCGATSRSLAKQIGERSKSLKDLIEKLNKKHLGGGRLKMIDEKTITGGYDRCYCGMVSKTSTSFPDLTYCHCSIGWYKQLFEAALGHPVEVKILKSIITGSKTCEFVIKIGKYK